MARAAGIHDLAARVPRGRNPMNVVKATYEALMSQRIPDEIARGLGKKLVDVRKVYYGGDQPTLDRPRRSQAPLESY
jgi:small subunit ribosomal protein S5